MRSISKTLLENILSFINMINGKVYINGKSYKADVPSIIELVRDSDAARFCKSPMDYFKNLDNTSN